MTKQPHTMRSAEDWLDAYVELRKADKTMADVALTRFNFIRAIQSDAIASVERLTAQPVKTLREVRESSLKYCWLWGGVEWVIAKLPPEESEYPTMLDELPAIPIIPPQPLPSTPEQEEQST